jgi:hypothetical protein
MVRNAILLRTELPEGALATKEYRFPHELGGAEARTRVKPVLDELVRAYGLNMESPSEERFRLSRTGVDANVTVADREIVIAVDLNWFLEKTVRSQLEDRLHNRILTVLKA